MKKIDLTGERFGRYKVLYEVAQRGTERFWKCLCDCGNEREVSQSTLRRGMSKSCGCLRTEMRMKDITGMRFGKLTAIKAIGKKNNKILWEFRCDCGNTKNMTSYEVTIGNTSSCGCLKAKAVKNMEKHREKLIVEGVHTYALTRKVNSRSSSGIKGVTEVTLKSGRKRYSATIGLKGVVYRLGTYDTAEEAIEARRKGEEKYHLPYLQKLEEKNEGSN